MKNLFIILLSLLIFSVYGQNKELLKITPNKENIVASAIAGSWSPKETEKEYGLQFTIDSNVLTSISKEYFKHLIIYQAGLMEVNRRGNRSVHPFLLTETDGNPHLIFFRERNNNPIGDGESFHLFIAIGEEKKLDRLFVGGDSNIEPFHEFERSN